ncbi:MAG: hypothetical protein KGD70_14625 [Candidatus Lokiarchaeota archaeon]|nr:hypothetical protein [Candidatus Lokiarchaeota archaeon]
MGLLANCKFEECVWFLRSCDFAVKKRELNFKEAKELVLKIAESKNQLMEFGIIRKGDEITNDYARWFCSKKYDLKLNDKESGYSGFSRFKERVKIVSRIGVDTNFKSTFDGIQIEMFDYLFVVFINEKNWMIEAIYKVSSDIVKDFLNLDQRNIFKWKREVRSLSLQIYPDEENMILL